LSITKERGGGCSFVLDKFEPGTGSSNIASGRPFRDLVAIYNVLAEGGTCNGRPLAVAVLDQVKKRACLDAHVRSIPKARGIRDGDIEDRAPCRGIVSEGPCVGVSVGSQKPFT